MKKSIFLFALLSVAIFGFNRAMAIELDTVWVSDISGQVLFQHPVSKNILVAANGGITELNSQDGKFFRSFPFDVTNSDLSPDGSKILNSEMNTKIYNYNEEQPIFTIENSMYGKFLGDNYIVYKTLKSNGNKIAKINLDTKETIITPVNGGITAISVSPDGKYISYATYEANNGIDSKAYLYLIDAETMKQVKELGSWETEGKYIRSVHFSPDSKYLTFDPEYYYSNFPLNIYDVEKRSLIKTFNKVNFNFEYGSITLLGNNLFLLNGANEFSLPKFKFELHNIEENKLLFSLDEFALGGGIYNKEFNHLYGTSKITMCLNIADIISGVPPINPIIVSYINKKLIINNNNKPINNISIMTIEGREVYRQNFERLLNVNNPIEIPLELSNGSYIINLVSDKETYTEKIIIVD